MTVNPFRASARSNPSLGRTVQDSVATTEATVVTRQTYDRDTAQLDRRDEVEWTLALVHASDRRSAEECFACNGGTSIRPTINKKKKKKKKNYSYSAPGAKTERGTARPEINEAGRHASSLYEFWNEMAARVLLQNNGRQMVFVESREGKSFREPPLAGHNDYLTPRLQRQAGVHRKDDHSRSADT